jgi:hypothetical protein
MLFFELLLTVGYAHWLMGRSKCQILTLMILALLPFQPSFLRGLFGVSD